MDRIFEDARLGIQCVALCTQAPLFESVSDAHAAIDTVADSLDQIARLPNNSLHGRAHNNGLKGASQAARLARRASPIFDAAVGHGRTHGAFWKPGMSLKEVGRVTVDEHPLRGQLQDSLRHFSATGVVGHMAGLGVVGAVAIGASFGGALGAINGFCVGAKEHLYHALIMDSKPLNIGSMSETMRQDSAFLAMFCGVMWGATTCVVLRVGMALVRATSAVAKSIIVGTSAGAGYAWGYASTVGTEAGHWFADMGPKWADATEAFASKHYAAVLAAQRV